MKRLLLWLLMVILLTALLVGGTIGFFYYKAGSTPLPGPEIAWGESQVEEPVGWQWDVPVLWGAYQRRVEEAPSLTVTKLGSLSSAPALTVPEWVTRGEITIKDEGGAAVFDGGLEEYAAFAYPANGQYQAVVRLWHDIPGERPAQPQGWYQYNLRFELNAVPSITFSKASVSQGTVVGVKVSGVLGNETPQSECDLGPIWFARQGGDWLGYLPVAFNAEIGEHVLIVTSGGQSMSCPVEVYQREFKRVELNEEPEEEELPAGAGEEYRREIWPLYAEGSLPKQWAGRFIQPVEGSVLRDYGIYLVTPEGTSRSSDLTLQAKEGAEVVMPADGQIAFAGNLKLGGNTVVVDHGQGVKTYISGLDRILVETGDTRMQKETIAVAGQDPVVIEIRIGNKSVYPWDIWRGTGGLFWS